MVGAAIGGMLLGKGVETLMASNQFDRNMAWQRSLAHSGYQMAANDMRKAGLNPILAVSRGFSPARGSPVGGTVPRMDVVADYAIKAATARQLNAKASEADAHAKLMEAQTHKPEATGGLYDDLKGMYEDVKEFFSEPSSARALRHRFSTPVDAYVKEKLREFESTGKMLDRLHEEELKKKRSLKEKNRRAREQQRRNRREPKLYFDKRVTPKGRDVSPRRR